MKASTKKTAVEFVDVNEEENKNRMLEDDLVLLAELKKIEKEHEAELKKINSQHKDNEMITFEDIEEIRNALTCSKKSTWTKAQSKKVKRNDTVNKSKYFYEKLCQEIDNNEYIDEKIQLEPNLNQLNVTERFLLYMSWVEKYRLSKYEELERNQAEYNRIAQSLQELRMQEDRSILEEAYIIAMTTTGSSRYHSVLKDIGPRIVIVEEAAEVFESHIVASLSKNCDHLILIGDHIQLRPNPAVYILAKDFAFDVSLFERLINNNTKKVHFILFIYLYCLFRDTCFTMNEQCKDSCIKCRSHIA